MLYRCWSSGSPSRARAAPLRPACQPPLSPTAPPSQPTISTGPRSQTQPPRPWPWLNPTPLTFMRSPGLSMRVGVSTRAEAAGVVTRKMGLLHRFCSLSQANTNVFMLLHMSRPLSIKRSVAESFTRQFADVAPSISPPSY